MKISVLMENVTPSGRFVAEHGLSLFLETGGARILFDVGPDERFLENALELGVDVRSAHAVVISHGHSDHGGGLHAYLDVTRTAALPAPVYIREGAFTPHAAGSPEHHNDIGLDPSLQHEPRILFAGEQLPLGDDLLLFSDVPIEHPIAESNGRLLEAADSAFAPDAFRHEQSLLVREGGRRILVSGCSHCGILNIMEKAEQIAGAPMDVVVGGFHLMDPGSGSVESKQFTRALAQQLAEAGARYYTFHCTGVDAYSILRDELGDRISYLYTGAQVEV